MTDVAAEAQPAVPQPGEPLRRDRHIRQQARQHEVENRALCVHHAARQAADRPPVRQIGHQEHRAGQHGRAVADDSCACISDRERCAVVRVDAHAARAQDELRALVRHFGDRRGDLVRIVAADRVRRQLTAVFRELVHEHGRERILDQPLFDLAAGGHHAEGARPEGEKLQKRVGPCGLARLLHLCLFDHQRDDARAAQLVALFDRETACPGRDHHVAQRVDRAQAFGVHQQQAVCLGGQLDLALLGRGGAHVRALTQGAQNIGCVVLVQHVLVVFPDVDVLFAHAEQHGDILRADDVPLAEHRVLGDAGNDLGDVVAEHLSDRVLNAQQLHGKTPPNKKIRAAAACGSA